MLLNAIGLLGPVLFTGAYVMLSLGRWQSHEARFHWCNLLGALCILATLFTQWNLPVCVLECCWACISLYGLVRNKRRR